MIDDNYQGWMPRSTRDALREKIVADALALPEKEKKNDEEREEPVYEKDY